VVAGAPAELIVRNVWPEHYETSLEALGHSWITRNDRFFVRSHFPVPDVDPRSYRLEVTGLVRNPLSLSLAEVQALPSLEATHTLECAGNGRGLFKLPSTSGTQWERGAVGNATWGGVRLSTLLRRAEPRPEAQHVWLAAADHAPLPDVPPFLRSLPLEKAMEDTLLAYTMNGEPLHRLHGAPLRAIVPGWYGVASTKWVTRIRVEALPSDNHFMARGYRYVYPGMDPALAPLVQELKVKSIITRPLQGSRVAIGKVRVQGFAWAGPAGVKLVEISSDGGKTWQPAGFMGDTAPNAWRTWATEIDVKAPAALKVMARALDGRDNEQPDEVRPNASGYGNNAIQVVSFRVA
jgi:DMSO/TMAO reductase YedYZ molybdopterin-dependent catalytic subunit